jgi:hypothetical protein
MKLARLFLAVLTISTLAACSDSVTGPRAEPAAKASNDEGCVLERQTDGTVVCRTGQTGSGG